ncbi:MAG: Ig-like domain-containing protein [Ardenticatenaceae bacterium]|nr:Ig-like domain-containing protein [Ardenticatenaceae bacterium]
MSFSSGPGVETAVRQQAIQSFAPAGADVNAPIDVRSLQAGAAQPVVVNLRDIPAGVRDPNSQLDRWQRGEIDLDEVEGIRGAAEMAAMQARSLELEPSANVQIAASGPAMAAPASGTGFDSLDYTECCGGGGNVPPDPELAVGPNHVIAVVNVAFEIYNKAGTSLVGPTTFASFMAANANCTGVFDPNANYDEEYDRYVLGIDADGVGYCIAVSQTGDPTGSWNLYYFDTISNRREFFDYPHAGIGQDAIYMGANIFRGNSFSEARVYAFDKVAMYNGQTASAVSVGMGAAHDTPQPLNLHGWAQGTWPNSGPHYIFAETNYDGSTHTVFAWADPFGANNFSTVGTVDLNAATGVTAGMPIDTPQQTGGTLQANDFRPQDFEYRDGFAWTSSTVACNPGGGTVNCVRWAKINPATATVADAGVYGSSGEYRTFADLAVDACGNMAIGYSKSSSSMFPGVFVTGRLATDTAGTLQTETLVKAGEISYTSFETSAPRRWGDYTEMTIDPAGTTFWYLGEYSKNTGTTNGRWGTYISSFSYNCNPGSGGDNPPTVTITAPNNGATVSNTVSITASASDDNGVTQVEFQIDGNTLSTDTNGADGWSASWDTTTASDGAHSITAVATDTANQTGSNNISVTVNNAPPSSISLSVNAYKVSGRKFADLTWSGASGTNVDVYYNGTLYTTTANNGAYTTNSLGRGGGTWSFQICETGSTTTCSAVVSGSW